MKDKMFHLQREITLMHIKHQLKSHSSGSNDISHQIQSARLKRQQNEIVHYLKSEVSRLKQEVSREQPNQQVQGVGANEQIVQNELDEIINKEIYRLRCEIFDHLLTMKSHLEETPQNQNEIEAIASEITTLKREIRRYLIEENMRLSNQYQEQSQPTEIKEQISNIKDEVKHLKEACNSQEYLIHHDDQWHVQCRGNNNAQGGNLELKPIVINDEDQD